ncbi:MAG: hypothetical protein IJD51_05785 [Clostridia bacterium]|nr:hypothetical protein [Clostridia bacterium]
MHSKNNKKRDPKKSAILGIWGSIGLFILATLFLVIFCVLELPLIGVIQFVILLTFAAFIFIKSYLGLKREALLLVAKKNLNTLGINASKFTTVDECQNALSKYYKSIVSEKYSNLKKKYNYSKIIDGVTLTNTAILYNVPTLSKTPPIVTDENCVNLLTEMKELDLESKIEFISYSSIKYYEVRGAIHYKNNVQGGGANLKGAMAGGLLFGGAGAIIGSQIGTEITTTTEEVDDRVLIVHLAYTEKSIASGKNLDEILLLFRRMMPSKEYSADKGFIKAQPKI